MFVDLCWRSSFTDVDTKFFLPASDFEGSYFSEDELILIREGSAFIIKACWSVHI